MKNAIKIQTEIMKHIKKYNEGKVPRNARFAIIERYGNVKIVVTLNNYIAYCFDPFEFYIDKTQMTETDILKKFFDTKETEKTIILRPTGTIKEKDGGRAVELESQTFKVYINEKYIKEYGNCEDLVFYGSGERNRVYVYEGGKLVGLTMPIRLPG